MNRTVVDISHSLLKSLTTPECQRNPLMASKCQAAIISLGQWALSGMELSELFNDTVTLIAQIFEVEYVNLWRLSSDRYSLKKVARLMDFSGHESRKAVDRVDHVLLPHLWEGDVIFFSEKNTPLDTDYYPTPIPPDSMNGLVITIPGKDQSLGILEIYSTKPIDFTGDDLHFFQSVSYTLGCAIERNRVEALQSTQTRILEEIVLGINLSEIFYDLCLLLEQELPGAYCSILIMDENKKQLRSGAAPSLPAEFAQGVDGLIISESAGSCGTAAYRGEAVFACDIATDPLWESFRQFALSHQIRACWSSPFLSRTGEVLGTFAISHRQPCHPTQHHLQVLKMATHLASIATENQTFYNHKIRMITDDN